MFFCNNCGQCEYLTEDEIIAIYSTSGWESWTVDDQGDTVDCTNSETTDSEFERYECTNCQSNDINRDWNGTEEEAIDYRESYDERIRQVTLARNKRAQEEIESRKQLKREWD